MFFAVFGGFWIGLWANDQYPRSISALLIVVLLATALLAAALRVYRRNSGALKALAQTPETRRRSRYFNIVNGAQWAAIFLVAFILTQTGLEAWILPSIILIVGLHFFPLARLFGYRPHYATGAALILVAITYPFVAHDGPASAFGALATGIILWLSAIVAISPIQGVQRDAQPFLQADVPTARRSSQTLAITREICVSPSFDAPASVCARATRRQGKPVAASQRCPGTSRNVQAHVALNNRAHRASLVKIQIDCKAWCFRDPSNTICSFPSRGTTWSSSLPLKLRRASRTGLT